MFYHRFLQLDLALAFCAIALLSCCALWMGRRVGSLDARRSADTGNYQSWISFVCMTMFSLAYCWQFHAKLSWVHAIPFSSVVLWSNLTPVLLAFTAGLAIETLALRRCLRPFIATSLGLLAIGFLVVPLARPWLLAPNIADNDQFEGFVCLQSHDSTCAPASAVTLLRLNGIDSSEKEMVKRCLTSALGTEALGLYRGLKIASQKSNLNVRLASSNPRNWVASGQLPNIALVHFPEKEFGPIRQPESSSIQSRSSAIQFFGDTRQEGHAVVVIGRANDGWLIADPAIGLDHWSDESLGMRFTGDAIYLCD